MSQYQHLNAKLAPVWDVIHSHLYPKYDFSLVQKVFVDDIKLNHDTYACHYRGTIVVDPKLFEYRGIFKSNYTHYIVQEKDLLITLLLHEIYHFLHKTEQVPQHTSIDEEEIAADHFAHKTLREMK